MLAGTFHLFPDKVALKFIFFNKKNLPCRIVFACVMEILPFTADGSHTFAPSACTNMEAMCVCVADKGRRERLSEGNSRAPVINSSLSDGEATGPDHKQIAADLCRRRGHARLSACVFQAARCFSGSTCIMQPVRLRLPAPFLFIFVRAQEFL